eukprot:m.3815 g.3815  ORF g.3815 m.3815 type:complete len:51 (-) comp3076_c0_seq1:81-233(-)
MFSFTCINEFGLRLTLTMGNKKFSIPFFRFEHLHSPHLILMVKTALLGRV